MAGKVNPDTIDESLFNSYLDTNDIPDPDLMIRTSGEQRLSNYLSLATGLFRVLFYRYSVAGIYERRAYKSGGRI